ncbi:hypothetical protein BpHYR1_038450 [Brachionus plicatilis]|uniref:Uncharacterized protein n=1 Tax=Brachionus plicatilis TaxID=10195 RepID=A0A3M7Q5K8_BRAPC|nr:hypothetical protein BpHYR1_038450 [Brachionus plicatilis]
MSQNNDDKSLYSSSSQNNASSYETKDIFSALFFKFFKSLTYLSYKFQLMIKKYSSKIIKILRTTLSSNRSLSCSAGHQALISHTFTSGLTKERMHFPVGIPFQVLMTVSMLAQSSSVLHTALYLLYSSAHTPCFCSVFMKLVITKMLLYSLGGIM